MKCDELEKWRAWQFPPSAVVYGANEVDAAIAELKDELDAANNQCENLINSATDIMLRQDKVNDAKCAEIENIKSENRRLKRALYKACANWAMNARMVEIEAEPWGENHESRLWAGVYDKCLKKAKEYK